MSNVNSLQNLYPNFVLSICRCCVTLWKALFTNSFPETVKEYGRRASLRYQMLQRRKDWLARDNQSGFIETEIQPNVKMRLYYDDELSRMIYCEAFEWYEREFLNRFLRPGDIFVDIGANIGLFSVIASHCVGATGHVLSFEPAPKPFQRLLENIQLNNASNVTCSPLAIAEIEGPKVMAISRDGYDAWNSFGHPIDGRTFEQEVVECTTWDRFVNDRGLLGKVTLMKIDIEGWESRMLQGARESFSRQDAPVLLIEFTDEASVAAGSSCQDLYRLLEDFGFEMCAYDGIRKRIVKAPLRSSYTWVNLIATKNPTEVVGRLFSKRMS